MTTIIDFENPTAEHSAPMEAFLFDAPHVKFAAAGEEQSQSKAVEILARTGDAINHWYWGRIVHDMDGMQAKDTVALDWCHSNELIGKADQMDTGSGDLVASGSLESLVVGDIADQIIKRSDRGIPYEASIYFDPFSIVLEYLGEGMTAEVNGRQINGPCVIAREWTLRRIALCPSGADGGTQTNFTEADKATRFSISWKDSPMSKDAKDTKPAGEGKSDEQTNLTAGGGQPGQQSGQQGGQPIEVDLAAEKTKFEAEYQANLKRFTDKFGFEDGAKYFAEGLSYELALERHVEKLEAKAQQADNQASEAQQKLSQLDLGEASGVDTGVASGEGSGSSSKKTFGSCFTAARKQAAQKA